MLSCVYFEIFYFEQLDPEILSSASSILTPFNIERSGFDASLSRFCTLVRHIYARISTYYLPCVLSAAGSIRSSCDSALFCDTLCTYTYVLLIVHPILRSFVQSLIKAHTSRFTEFVSQYSINGLRVHVFTKYVLHVTC